MMRKKNGKVLAEMYLPALATAFNIHIRISQEAHGYISISTIPPINYNHEETKTFAMLVWEDKKYKVMVRNDFEYEDEEIDVTTCAEVPVEIDLSTDHPYITNHQDIPTPTEDDIHENNLELLRKFQSEFTTETSYASPNKEEINSSSNSSSPTITKSTNPYREISSDDNEKRFPHQKCTNCLSKQQV